MGKNNASLLVLQKHQLDTCDLQNTRVGIFWLGRDFTKSRVIKREYGKKPYSNMNIIKAVLLFVYAI